MADARRRLREADLERHFTHQEAESADTGEEGPGDVAGDAEETTDVQLARAVEVLKSWTYFERLGVERGARMQARAEAGGESATP